MMASEYAAKAAATKHFTLYTIPATQNAHHPQTRRKQQLPKDGGKTGSMALEVQQTMY